MNPTSFNRFNSKWDEPVYYFAYGSNMSKRQMRQRCPNATYMGPALLRNWKLRERTFADVDRHKGHVVHGVAWEITPRCLRSLDNYEGVSCGLYEHAWDYVTLEDGRHIRVLIYTETREAKKSRDNVPFSMSYACLCAESALELDIPVHRLYKDRIRAYAESMGAEVDIRREALNW